MSGISGKATNGRARIAPKNGRPPFTVITIAATAPTIPLMTNRIRPTFSDSGAGLSILETRAKIRQLNGVRDCFGCGGGSEGRETVDVATAVGARGLPQPIQCDAL